ncbi:hypothetical protein [Chroococcidiopsis sp. CCMEE 29]|jgi:hypothetical protein|uniref:hypothetical protein n=1 Tax=Chroococcidiopsis sp. CCMEE 29 TaxID=155894 RepID=UPI002020FE9B|nr:hypothetical protein [Chroococcidiopsis sp. CCMEE 29]
MKKSVKSLTKLVLCIAGIGVVSLLLPQTSWAQTTNVNPLQDFEPEQNNNDPFSSRSNEVNSFGVFDLMHRAQMGQLRNAEDFSTEQNQNLDAAAAAFRESQRKRLEGQQQAVPTNPIAAPQPSR